MILISDITKIPARKYAVFPSLRDAKFSASVHFVPMGANNREVQDKGGTGVNPFYGRGTSD